jgi:predicted MFS family arabinose efflux permease
MMSASLVQFTIGALAPLILVDLGISRARLGVLLSAYYLTAAATSAGFGKLIGGIGGRAGLRIVASLAVTACLAVSVAHDQLVLGAGLLLAGLAVAAANPATNLAIAQLPPPHGVLVGVKQSGFQFAAVVAGSVMPLIAGQYGWRAAFLVEAAMGAIVLLTLITWRRLLAQPTPHPPVAEEVASTRGIGTLAAYAYLMGIGTANAGVYLALFAHQRLAFSAQTAGAVVLVLGLASVSARIGWNLLVERVHHRWADQRSVLIMIAVIAIGSTGTIAASAWWGATLLWAGALGIGLSASAWNGVVMLGLVSRDTAPRALGKSSGQVQGAFFLGLATGPPVFGLLVDGTGHYGFGWLWSAVSFGAALVVALRLVAPTLSYDLDTTSTHPIQEHR